MRLIVYALALLIALPAGAAEISGEGWEVRVIDGDTIKIKGERIRLQGIDAPELNQQCQKESGCYECGDIFWRVLGFFKAKNPRVTCHYTKRDRYGRIIGKCFAGNVDLSAWMVRGGMAIAYRKYSTDYVRHEDEARKAKRGLWEGEFITPEKWRRGERLACEREPRDPTERRQKRFWPPKQ